MVILAFPYVHRDIQWKPWNVTPQSVILLWGAKPHLLPKSSAACLESTSTKEGKPALQILPWNFDRYRIQKWEDLAKLIIWALQLRLLSSRKSSSGTPRHCLHWDTLSCIVFPGQLGLVPMVSLISGSLRRRLGPRAPSTSGLMLLVRKRQAMLEFWLFTKYYSDHATVDAFHKAGLDAGGECHGPPGLRPQYGANYYGAFLLDPLGNNIEAVSAALISAAEQNGNWPSHHRSIIVLQVNK